MPAYLVDAQPDHIDCGEFISALFRKGGKGTHVFLKQAVQYRLHTPIVIGVEDATIATEGYPEDDLQKAVLLTVGDGATAVNILANRVKLSHVVIDGQEPSLGRSKNAEALVFVGGNGNSDCLVQDCVLRHTRGWTCLHLFDRGKRMRVINNRIGPSGRAEPDGVWADGISVACIDGIITGNTIVDATDGGIVIFGAPGSIIANNTIIARSRKLLGAINLVDFAPYEGDYTNTRVYSNRIISDGAYIKLGIGIGGACWGDWLGVTARGGFVEDNHFLAGTMGYAVIAAGCKDFTIQGNIVSPNVRLEGDMLKVPWNPAPTPFLKTDIKDCAQGSLQPDFISGPVRYLLGVDEGLSTALKFFPDGLHLDSETKPFLRLKDANLSLSENGNLQLVDNKGRTLWESLSQDSSCSRAQFSLNADGRIKVTRKIDGKVLWQPTSDIATSSLTIRSVTPYLSAQDSNGNITFATSYTFGLEWRLNSGNFVVIVANESSISLANALAVGPQQYWQKPTFLVLEAATSQLVLHSGKDPLKPEYDSTWWRSPNWTIPKDSEEVGSVAVLQGDGNFVIYCAGAPIWATGSNGFGNIRQIRLNALSANAKASLELLNDQGEVKWSTLQ